MSNEEPITKEKEPIPSCRLIAQGEKQLYKENIISLLHEYPENFFPGYFEDDMEKDYAHNEIAVAFSDGEPKGCLFYNPSTQECNWLSISKTYEGDKNEVAKKLFTTVFALAPSGSKVFWYVNTEDSEWESKPVGKNFEPARRLYEKMGATFTREENKFGEGNHAYRVEIST